MKKLVVLVCLVSLAAGASFAQPVDPDPNGIGVYFDAGATMTEATLIQYVPASVYVVATNIETDGLQAFEFTFEMAAAGALPLIQTTTFQGTNFGTAPEYIVGTGTPMPYADAIVLVTFGLFPMGADRVDFYLGPLSAPSIDGAAAFADGLDAMHLVGFQPSNGDWTLPIAIANGGGAVVIATEDETWGGVKSLYR